ncbi:hypothetical protein ES703_83091 [subsurface metagenome]
MLLFVAGENFNNDIVRGLLRRKPELDIVRVGKSIPGVFEVSRSLYLGAVIEDILLLAECSLEGDWESQVRYLPLR